MSKYNVSGVDSADNFTQLNCPEPLPWEIHKGFLWGLPYTTWLLIRHPSDAFSRKSTNNWYKSFQFFFLISVFSRSFVLILIYLGVYDKKLLLDPDAISLSPSLSEVVINTSIIVSISWLPDALLITIMTFILYFVSNIMFHIQQKMSSLLRLLFYSNVSIVVEILPFDTSFISSVLLICILFFGIKSTASISFKLAFSITGLFWLIYSLAYFAASRLPDPYGILPNFINPTFLN